MATVTQPKEITIYNSTAFGSNVPDLVNGLPFFEYEPPGPIDFMRYRMNRIWNKAHLSNFGNIGSEGQIRLDSFTPNADPPYQDEGTVSGNRFGRNFRNREKITITYDSTDLDECGTEPEPGIGPQNILSVQRRNKWLKVINSTLPATIQPLDNHGIISTFSKLQEPEDFNVSATPVVFQDHVFTYQAPVSKKEAQGSNVQIMQADIKPVYNFFIHTYEGILDNADNPSLEPNESILPSLYAFLSVMQNQDVATRGIQRTSTGTGPVNPATINTIFEKHITLNRTIDEARVDTMVTYNRGSAPLKDMKVVSKGQYFDKWADTYAQGSSVVTPAWARPLDPTNPNSRSLQQRFKNQICPVADVQGGLFSTFNDVVNRFPMYVDLVFSTQSPPPRPPGQTFGSALNALELTQMTTLMIKDFVDEMAFPSSPDMDFNFLSSSNLPFKVRGNISDYPKNPQQGSFRYDNRIVSELVASGSLQCWDMKEWLDLLPTRLVGLLSERPFTQPQKAVFLGNQFSQELEVAQQRPGASMQNNLKVTILNILMGVIVSAHFRTWKEIVGGKWPIPGVSPPQFDHISPKQAVHETLFYKVEKWEIDAEGNAIGLEPRQNFYFPNSTNLTEHRFTDTQVKYGRRYLYKIYAMELVYGTKYWYQLQSAPAQGYVNLPPNPNPQNPGQNVNWDQARICALTEPSLKLIKLPYYEKEIVMMDHPPVWPDAEITTYQNIHDQILFWFKGNVGDYEMQPVIIQSGDQEVIDSLRLAQERDPIEPLRFKSDDQARFFEVFRLEEKPIQYSDFARAKIAHVDTSLNIDQIYKTSTSGEWIDKTIKPNQKYYYIFRSIDNHGHFSNPSPVYELEMVYDGYAPFLIRKVYYLGDDAKDNQIPTKDFKKYLYIKPAFAQTMINEEASGLNNLSNPPPTPTAGSATPLIGPGFGSILNLQPPVVPVAGSGIGGIGSSVGGLGYTGGGFGAGASFGGGGAGGSLSIAGVGGIAGLGGAGGLGGASGVGSSGGGFGAGAVVGGGAGGGGASTGGGGMGGGSAGAAASPGLGIGTGSPLGAGAVAGSLGGISGPVGSGGVTPSMPRGGSSVPLNPLSRKGADGSWIVLGTEDESLWGKKIKIRIISKITGKRIDLNIKYTHKHIEPPPAATPLPTPASRLLPRSPTSPNLLGDGPILI